MIEIPPNVMMERLKSFDTDEEVPDEWKAIPNLTEEQAKIYRAKAVILKFEGEYKFCSLRVEGVIPIYSGNKVIGCLGEVTIAGEEVVAEVILDNATPERLEIEMGGLWAKSGIEVNNRFPSGDISAGKLTSVIFTKTQCNYPPIGQV